MLGEKSANIEEQKYFKVMLYAGIILSETQILVNIKEYTPIFTFPYFTIAYFAISTLHLAYSFASYAFLSGRAKGVALQSFESIMLPISVLLISLLAKNAGMAEFKAISVILLAVQSLLMVAKIIYFNSVTSQLAQISTINKLIRVVKLNIIALLPLIVTQQLIVVVIVALCQALSISAFFLKFTYQKCIYEYVLMVGVFCGVISAIQNVFQTIFGLNYLFIGELSSLFFFFHQKNYLQTALELKYTNSLTNSLESKQDDEILAGLLFINECLFEKKRSLKLSQSAKNEGVIQACTILDRLKGNMIRGEQIQSQFDPIFQMQLKSSCREVSIRLFEAYCNRFHQTDSFSCFEFTVNSALQLGGNFTNKALILYYAFVQRKKEKTSIFEACKFQYLYLRILKQVEQKQIDKDDINFIEFSDNLKFLNSEIEDCLTNELKLIEYLSDKSKKAEMVTDERLLARNSLKSKIRQRIETCINQRIYFSSNQFKFLYLLYQVTIEKRYEALKVKLKKYFLASEVQKLRFQCSENSLIVLSGFNHGQIINSNEVFKSHFGITLSSFSRSNISEFIPTQKQRVKHSTMMTEFVELRLEKQSNHSEYDCLLAIERQFGAVKLKVVENFTISVRIYYENRTGFHYICSLMRKEKQITERELLTLLRRDCENFSNKGIQFTIVKQVEVNQLGERLELSQIQFSFESHSLVRFSSNMKGQNESKKDKPHKEERFLQEKAIQIEKKLLEEGNEDFRYTVSNVIEICAIIVFTSLIFVMFTNISSQIDNLAASITKLLKPINQAQLIHNRILLEQEILSLQVQTPYFSDNLCQSIGIPSINAYIINTLSTDLQNNTDIFIGTLSQIHNYGTLNENLYQRYISSVPYLMNPTITISYHKYVQLMKSQTFTWLSNLKSAPLNLGFYSQLFPSIMLNSTLDKSNSLTILVENSQIKYIADLNTSIQFYQALSFVFIGLLGVIVVTLRVMDNIALIRYLKIVECIKPEQLSQRTKELKSALTQLHQLRANRIQSIEYDRTFVVEIKSDKKQPESFPLEQFTQWHLRNKTDYELEESDSSFYDEQKEFIQRHGKQDTENIVLESQLLRLIFYKKVYLILMVGIVITTIVLTNSALQMESNRVKTLVLCNDAAEQLNKIQQKFINIIAYNWLKVLSLKQTFTMTGAKTMFNEAVNSLLASEYQSKMTAAYSKEISDQVLYGEVCPFFNDNKACQGYRNNLFSSGFSMLIPFVIKEEVEIDQISTNSSYYMHNLCDKTWLLFEGIIPMTENIAYYGFNAMNTKANQGFITKFLEIGATIFVALVLTAIFQYRRYVREKMIREEVFSLETVENLYTVAQFKPYFNKIYYA